MVWKRTDAMRPIMALRAGSWQVPCRRTAPLFPQVFAAAPIIGQPAGAALGVVMGKNGGGFAACNVRHVAGKKDVQRAFAGCMAKGDPAAVGHGGEAD